MKTYYDCYPCFVKQALGVLKYTCATDGQIRSVMRSVFHELTTDDFDSAPPTVVQRIYSIICNTMKIDDPFAGEKKHFNEVACKLLSEIKNGKDKKQISFVDIVKFAIAANIIDFGKNTELSEQDVKNCFEIAQKKDIDEQTVWKFQDALATADNILYLCDNSGEIVFDRFLIENLPYHKIICAVRGTPIINDATLEDAKIVGLSTLVKTISNGSGAPGTVLQQCSHEFRHVFNKADIIIAKGQGNFETLNDNLDKRIFFLLQVKCPVIASHIGYPVGSFVIKDSYAEKKYEKIPVMPEHEIENENLEKRGCRGYKTNTKGASEK